MRRIATLNDALKLINGINGYIEQHKVSEMFLKTYRDKAQKLCKAIRNKNNSTLHFMDLENWLIRQTTPLK